MEKLRWEVGVFREEAGEEFVKVGLARGKNERGTFNAESGCDHSALRGEGEDEDGD